MAAHHNKYCDYRRIPADFAVTDCLYMRGLCSLSGKLITCYNRSRIAKLARFRPVRIKLKVKTLILNIKTQEQYIILQSARQIHKI